MTGHRAALFGICVSVATAAVASSVDAQAEAAGCIDASVLVAAEIAPPMMPVLPVDDVQWCVDSDDPRCSPDPVGAPAAHLAHAGDLGQLANQVVVRKAPIGFVEYFDHVDGRAIAAFVVDLERPPRAG